MKSLLCAVLFSIFISCAPVLSQNLLNQGTFNVNLSEIKENPSGNKGRLYIMGGIIVKTTLTGEGSLIEALYEPVNSRGYLRGIGSSSGRFLAIYRGKELLDPLVYSEKREITLAGELIGTQSGKIGEMDYTYPLFEIKQVYLWPEVKEKEYYYYYPPPPYPWYYRHRIYDPWWYYY